jgi:hypothetical protein
MQAGAPKRLARLQFQIAHFQNEVAAFQPQFTRFRLIGPPHRQ